LKTIIKIKIKKVAESNFHRKGSEKSKSVRSIFVEQPFYVFLISYG